jgi:hypothetical protein
MSQSSDSEGGVSEYREAAKLIVKINDIYGGDMDCQLANMYGVVEVVAQRKSVSSKEGIRKIMTNILDIVGSIGEERFRKRDISAYDGGVCAKT